MREACVFEDTAGCAVDMPHRLCEVGRINPLVPFSLLRFWAALRIVRHDVLIHTRAAQAFPPAQYPAHRPERDKVQRDRADTVVVLGTAIYLNVWRI